MDEKEFIATFGSVKSIGALLREIRCQQHLTLACLASRLNISSANLCDLEQGRKIPSLQRSIFFAERLDLPKACVLEISLKQLLLRQRLRFEVSVADLGKTVDF